MIKRPTREELAATCERLRANYQERFGKFGGSFDCWANGAQIAGEAAFGGSVGPMCGAAVRYARRTGWHGLFGRLVSFKTLEDAELELSKELDVVLEKLASGERPRIFGGI
ncbi:MAG: hypothetical protein AABM40_00440 [Chloroflexota bacterium]